MASMRYIYTCCFVFAVIAARVFPLVEGRQLKAMEKQKFNSFVEERGLSNHAKKTTQEKNIAAGREGEFHVAPPAPSYYIVSGREVTSPKTSTDKNPEFDNRLASSTTDFKPTAPGNSPGVGHSVVASEQDDQQRSPSSHSVDTLSSSPDDFKPTTPGVGHSFNTMKIEPNA